MLEWLRHHLDTLQLLRWAHVLQHLQHQLFMLPRTLLRQAHTSLGLLLAASHLQRPGLMVTTRAQRRADGPPADTLDQVLLRLRGLSTATYTPASNKHAAVLVPLFEDAQGCVRVWLTQRSANMRSHKGEVCLPGGKRDPDDADDVATALREAHEELGLDPQQVTVLCTLPPYLSKHLLSVTPVVGQVPRDFVPVPNPSEVGAVFNVPLTVFLEDAHHIHWDVPADSATHGRLRYRIHSFEHEGYVIWGLTASVLIHVARRALGRAPSFQVDTPGPRGVPAEQLWYNGSTVSVRPELLGAVAPDPRLDEEGLTAG